MRRAHRRPAAAAVAAAAAMACAGCSTPVVLSSAVDSHRPGAPVVGLVYALPKAQAELVAERRQVKPADVVKAEAEAAKARQAAVALAAQLAEATDKAKAAGKLHDAAQEPAKADLLKQLTLAQAVVVVLTAEAAAAKQRADESERQAEMLAARVGQTLVTASVKFLPVVPDPDAQLVAAWERHLARDDEVKIGVVNGLLSSVDLASTDRTAGILVSLAQGVAAFASGLPGLLRPTDKSYATRADAQRCPVFRAVYRFDPTSPAAVCDARSRLNKDSGGALELRTGGAMWGGVPTCQAVKPRLPGADAPGSGLYYRAPRQATVAVGPPKAFDQNAAAPKCPVEAPVDPGGASIVVATAVVPDSQRLFQLPMEAGTFTRTTHKLTFKEGMPQEMGITSPSQLAAAASLPLDIAKAILEVPGTLIKLRVDYDSKAADSVKQQAELLKQQLELLKAQRALDQALTNP